MKKLFVLLGAVALVVAFTAPTFAAEWSFYGSARIHTFWENYDYGDYTDKTGQDDDLDLDHKLQSNARIGANVKVSDNLVGRFEYGSGPNLRILWGEYDFGGFKLGVGQHYTPLNWFYSNQVWDGDFDLLFAGGIYNGRRAMVRGKFGGLEIALVQPVTAKLYSPTIAPPVGPGVAFAHGDTDVVIPNLQLAYNFKVAGLSIDIGGGYQSYKVVDTADNDEDISSYIVAIGGTYNMGPFYFGANYWMGQNVGNMGMVNTKSPLDTSTRVQGDAVWNPIDEDVSDNDGWGFIVCAAFTLSDMLRFEAGYGMNSFDIDKADEKDDTSTYYVQATINLAKGVFIVPEIGVVDYGDDSFGNDEGKLNYYGLKWQINF